MGQLSAFESVCRTGSTLAAAADLSLTQGAVSKLIHGLEAQLGARLFLQSLRLARARVDRSFDQRVAHMAHDIEQRFRGVRRA